tara:strand:+ start:37 stop:219 length:183 start_codon:yes stop_codon:yes gene_type:complete
LQEDHIGIVLVSVVNVEDGVEIGSNVVVYLSLLTAIHGSVSFVVGSTGVMGGHAIIEVAQ